MKANTGDILEHDSAVKQKPMCSQLNPLRIAVFSFPKDGGC